jgi:hypothetical protein
MKLSDLAVFFGFRLNKLVSCNLSTNSIKSIVSRLFNTSKALSFLIFINFVVITYSFAFGKNTNIVLLINLTEMILVGLTVLQEEI